MLDFWSLGAGADATFQRDLQGKVTEKDAQCISQHVLMEFARMGLEDGLVTHGIVDMEDAHEIALDAAYRLAKRAYRCSEE